MIANWRRVAYVLSSLLSVSTAGRPGPSPTSEPCTDPVVPPPNTDAYHPPANTITLIETETCTIIETAFLPGSTTVDEKTVTATASGIAVTVTDTITASGSEETITCTETVTATPTDGEVDHTITVTATPTYGEHDHTITVTATPTNTEHDHTVTVTATPTGGGYDHTVTVTATPTHGGYDHTITVTATPAPGQADHTVTVTATLTAGQGDRTVTVTATPTPGEYDHTVTVTATLTGGQDDHTVTVTATPTAGEHDHTVTVTTDLLGLTVTQTETVTTTAASVQVTHTETVTDNSSPSTVTLTETVVTTSEGATFLYTQTVTEDSPVSALKCSTEPNPLVSTVFISAEPTVQVTVASTTITETVRETETLIESATVTVTEVVTSSLTQPTKLPSLAEALIAAGCSNFLRYIQSNATIWELFNSPQTQTVFAPSDRFFSYNASFIASRFWARGESTNEAGQATYQSGSDRANMARIRSPPGVVQNTNNRNANLNGGSQKVVSDTRDPSVAGQASKRDILARADLLARQSGNASVNLDSLVRIDSGLGAVNNVINGDIAYTGGLIQVTDGLFTLPKNTTRTSLATGETTFADLANRAGLLDLVDKTPSITVFIPSNKAFDVAKISQSTNITELAKILGGHVVQSTAENRQSVGYLPNLKDGETLTTTTGSTLQITVSGDDYFINDALITRANLILENGVAHVIDKVVDGTQALPAICSAASTTTSPSDSSTTSQTPNSGTASSPLRLPALFSHYILTSMVIMFFGAYGL